VRAKILPVFILIAAIAICAMTVAETVHARDVEIIAKPIMHFKPDEPNQILFGRLQFMGGLELSSDNDDFGGLSGLRMTDSRLYAVTDQGMLFTGRLQRISSRLADITEPLLTPILGRNGKAIRGKRNADAEALELSGNQAFIGFERNDRILAFERKADALRQIPSPLSRGLNEFAFPNNKGPEAVAAINEDKLLTIAEYAVTVSGNHSAFIVSNGPIQRLEITNIGYSITDADILGEDLFVLERFYTPFTGSAMRIRRFDINRVQPGAILDGEVLLEADNSHEIDNMEGLAAMKQPDGTVRLTLVSDNNFSDRQRTLLLEFELTGK